MGIGREEETEAGEAMGVSGLGRLVSVEGIVETAETVEGTVGWTVE